MLAGSSTSPDASRTSGAPDAAGASGSPAASVRDFVETELTNIDGERFDYVCPQLARPMLLASTDLVIEEVARRGGRAFTNLVICVGYSVVASRDESGILARLKAFSAKTSDEERVQGALVKAIEHPDPDGP